MTGTGARLGFHPSEPQKSYTLIAVALLRHCPPLFGPLGLDLGIVVEPDSVFAFMTGHVSPSKWSIEAQGENPDFKAVSGDLRKWAREKVNEVTQPKAVPKCGLDVPGKMTVFFCFLKRCGCLWKSSCACNFILPSFQYLNVMRVQFELRLYLILWKTV